MSREAQAVAAGMAAQHQELLVVLKVGGNGGCVHLCKGYEASQAKSANGCMIGRGRAEPLRAS